MLEFSHPVNYRRVEWFTYNPNEQFGWRYAKPTPRQATLTRGAWHGHMPNTDPVSPRSYLSYFLE